MSEKWDTLGWQFDWHLQGHSSHSEVVCLKPEAVDLSLKR